MQFDPQITQIELFTTGEVSELFSAALGAP